MAVVVRYGASGSEYFSIENRSLFIHLSHNSAAGKMIYPLTDVEALEIAEALKAQVEARRTVHALQSDR